MNRLMLAAAVLLGTLANAALAQVDILSGSPLDRLGASIRPAPTDENTLRVSAWLTPAEENAPARVWVKVRIESGWHIYSLSQPPGGPKRTRITVEGGKGYRVVGDFQPDHPPKQEIVALWGNLPVETHEGEVIWHAPLAIQAGVDLSQLEILGKVNAQACSETSCLIPEDFPFKAAIGSAERPYAQEPPSPLASAAGRVEANAHLEISGRLEPASVRSGEKARLVITALPQEGWHIYALADFDPEQLGSKPTLIVLEETGGLVAGRVVADSSPKVQPSGVPGVPDQRFHEGPVEWTVDLAVPADAKEGLYSVRGIIGYQTCRDSGCDLPAALRFETRLAVSQGGQLGGVAQATFRPARYPEAARAAKGAPATAGPVVAVPGTNSLPWILLSAFAGGLILNLMPCVLPVIGLKILSFVEQSGQRRGRVIALNFWYTLGVLAVFMLLAALSVGTRQLAWGEQFSSTPFNVAMAALVFAMALGFLGVWEIPIPGFVGVGRTADLAAQEGGLGAFCKGAVSTILATPCSGPALGSVFGFTLTQPPPVAFAVFACVAMGMASPYLAIGLFPQFVRFLPKPGAWMETFKQAMAFPLLGTVVFFLYFLQEKYVVPTVGLLIGIWACCWWVGRSSLTFDLGRRIAAWFQGVTVAAAVGWFSFSLLIPGETIIPWQPFSRARLEQLLDEGRTVMVDFTADWCLVCKVNLGVAINTQKVRSEVDANGVVPLLADFTDGSAEIKQTLKELGFRSIPLLAIYPAGQPNQPIVLPDLISQNAVVQAIKTAGPSRSREQTPGDAPIIRGRSSRTSTAPGAADAATR